MVDTTLFYPYTGIYNGSRDSSVGIATDYGMDGRIRFPVRAGDFSLLHSVQTGPGVKEDL
jgi:hypothetical protein